MGYEVHIVTDAISSNNELDRKVGLRRMEKAGALLTTFELVLFEIIKDQTNPQYDEFYNVFKTNETSPSEKFTDF